ncbi:FKBP-type peptidyl-prolyl cis-trans isomerase [Thauera mechernichensis]
MTTIIPGIRVTAAYRFHDEDGTLIDSSLEHGPMTFIHGGGSVLPAIETALLGCAPGDSLSLQLPPEQAFGPYRAELVFEAPAANLPPGIELEPGIDLFSGSGDRPAFRLRVVRRTELGAVLDGNHPLAGKTLRIELEVLSTEANRTTERSLET